MSSKRQTLSSIKLQTLGVIKAGLVHTRGLPRSPKSYKWQLSLWKLWNPVIWNEAAIQTNSAYVRISLSEWHLIYLLILICSSEIILFSDPFQAWPRAILPKVSWRSLKNIYHQFLQLRFSFITSNLTLYPWSRNSVRGWKTSAPETLPWNQGAGWQGEVRAVRVRDGRPSVHLLCSVDLLWKSRGNSLNHMDKLPAS